MEPIQLSAEDAAQLAASCMVEIQYFEIPVDTSVVSDPGQEVNTTVADEPKFQLGLVQIDSEAVLQPNSGSESLDINQSFAGVPGKELEVVGECLVCLQPLESELTALPELSAQDLLNFMSKALKVHPVTSEISNFDSPPSAVYCSQCYNVLQSVKTILDEMSRLDQELCRMGELLKASIISSNNRCPAGIQNEKNKQIAELKNNIRRTFIQCWGNCQVNLLRQEDKTSDYTISVSKRGRPRKLRNVLKWTSSSRKSANRAASKKPMAYNMQDVVAVIDDEFQTDDADDFHVEFGIAEDVANNTDFKKLHQKNASKSAKVENIPSKKRTKLSASCKFCNKVFRSEKKLEQHYLQHEGSHKCEKCSKSFESLKNLQIHMGMSHPDANDDGSKKKPKDVKDARFVFDKNKNLESFQCKHCNKTFKRSDTAESDEDGRRHFLCPDPGCGKTFPKFGVLANHHEKTCLTGPENFECEYCHKKCFSLKTLESHKASFHTKQYDFYCELCGHGVPTKWALQRHMLGHTGERKFQCELCQQTFKRKDYLILHMRRHNNEMAFMCGQCGKRFISKQELKLHEDRHENIKQFPCPLCGKLFASKPYVSNHIWATHKKSRSGKRKRVEDVQEEMKAEVIQVEDKLFKVPAGNYRLFRVCTNRTTQDPDSVKGEDNENHVIEYITESLFESTPEVTATVTIPMDEV